MTKEERFHHTGEADEQKVAAAGLATPSKRNSRPVWIKWGILAACLCLVAISAYAISFRFHTHKDAQSGLMAYMDALDLPAQTISDPLFSSLAEGPMVTKSDLINMLKNNTVVYGSVETLDCVRTEGADGVWYIATMTIKVDEVLVGTADSEVRLVCASHYNFDIEDDLIPIPQIIGCHQGMHGVFVLNDTFEGNWQVSGREVDPSALGDYLVISRLGRNGDDLIDPYQHISVSIHELG